LPAYSASRSSPAIAPIATIGTARACSQPTPTCAAAAPSTIPKPTNLTALLLAGSNAPLPVEHAFMPSFARGHSDDELAAVANFVNGFFSNGMAKVTTDDIDKARKALP
jgi:mono/diheme cytochrome c family protein